MVVCENDLHSVGSLHDRNVTYLRDKCTRGALVVDSVHRDGTVAEKAKTICWWSVSRLTPSLSLDREAKRVKYLTPPSARTDT